MKMIRVSSTQGTLRRRVFSAFWILLLAAVGSWSLTAALLADPPETVVPEVKNPSFEITNPNGTAQNWSGDRTFFQVEYGSGRTGNAALRWDSPDGKNYRLHTQSTAVTPGAQLEFSVWVKTENVKEGRATICMEWNGPDGKWLGGAYALGEKGTVTEWTKVTGRADIPDNVSRASVTCYVTRGGAGTAWFDDVEIKPYAAPILTGINSDHYRNMTDGSDLRVRVGVSPRVIKEDFAKLANPLVVTGPSLAEPLRLTPSGSGADYLKFIVPGRDLKPGAYDAAFSITHPLDGSVATIHRPFTRVEAYPERKTFIDGRRRAIVDGKPFFPLGCYFSDVDSKTFDIYADSAFNCLMPYNPIGREQLDLCSEKNIKVIYSVKDNFRGLAVPSDEMGIERTKKKVAEMKDHPAIFAWYINDELPLTMIDELTARRDLMEELDPSRPTWVVLYQIGDIRAYIPTFDVIGTDPYPIPQPAAKAGDYSRRTNDAVFGQQALWQVPQIFNWASYKKTPEEKKTQRSPTAAEIRGMAWMSIAGGANGLVFYSWFDLWRMSKTVEEGGTALVAEPFEDRWADVKKTAAEIAEYFPVLLSDGDPIDVRFADGSDPEVMRRDYGHEGKTWILLVNQSDEPKKAVLTIPTTAKPEGTRLGGRLDHRDGIVTVELQPLEPSFVLLTP